MFKLSTVAKLVGGAAVAFAVAAPASAVTTTSLSPLSSFTAPDQVSGVPLTIPSIGLFDNYYLFQIGGTASGVSSTVNFNPTGGITGFTGALYAASNVSGNSANVGALQGNFSSTSSTELTLGWTSLTAGYYVIRLQGNAVTNGVGVSGQVTTRNVPAPAVLGLMGVGLLGMFASSRRRV
jgi:hypothetical protein